MKVQIILLLTFKSSLASLAKPREILQRVTSEKRKFSPGNK